MLGGFVLKKYRSEHISNEKIYQILGIYPIDIIVAIQTLLFWNKIVENERSHPMLRSGALSIFTSNRRTSFTPKIELSPPLQNLLRAFEVYKMQLQKNGEIYYTVPSSKIFSLTKEHLDGGGRHCDNYPKMPISCHMSHDCHT